ncbi:RBBP9/YdeN family alpha/beta hydrolase [Kribbella sp. NPDC004536]|uniref:RBBP9/YdeN family alpha/beta hydrolase n=1 Tax=Kribbella sp. NPDC004536 TaxID=3364106 RepID=UPI0036AD649A
MTYIIIPGLDGSDEHHWQSHWETTLPAIRIQPTSWTTPDLTDWTNAITRAVNSAPTPITFITHSLGCHAAAHWLTTHPSTSVRGAFLVAPPDPTAPTFPTHRLPTFATPPTGPLGIPATLIASTNDPYCTLQAAIHLSKTWQAHLIPLPDLGHINTQSKLGPWPQGHQLLTTFETTL